MAGEAVTTDKLFIPDLYIDTINEKVRAKSVVAALSTATPQIFANANYLVFSEKPHGEYIGEGEAKSPSTFAFTPVVAKPHKFQTTVRLSEEVQWADEDSKMRLLDEVIDALTDSVAEGLDYGAIHGWNPRTKAAATGLAADALSAVANQVTATGDAQADIDALPDSVIEAGYRVNGIGLDLGFASAIRKLRVEATGAKMYPEITLDLEPSRLEGLRASTSDTVSGAALGVGTGVEAIVGNWDMLKWGYVRDFAVEAIKYGDPDGLGDLKRYNQVAYRIEAVFSWAILDPTAFAVLKTA